MKFHLGILSLAMVVLPKVVSAQAITYSGRLTDGTGWDQSTQVQMVVRFYDSESAGSLLWSSPQMTVSVVDGFFSVMLSQGTGPDGNPLGVDEVFSKNASVWMSLVVDDQEMVPR